MKHRLARLLAEIALPATTVLRRALLELEVRLLRAKYGRRGP